MMSRTLDEIILGQEAIDYIAESLRDGQELSSLLLDTIRLDAGRAVTYLPKGTSRPFRHRLSEGGILAQPRNANRFSLEEIGKSAQLSPIPTTDDVAISLITAHLSSEPDPVCLFENHFARPQDPWLIGSKVHRFSLGPTVCHY